MKLLAPKPITEFTPEEFHVYIQSLFEKKEKQSTKKEQKDLKVRIKRKKDGSLSIVTKRNPPYITEKELQSASGSVGVPEPLLFTSLQERGFRIFPDHRTATKLLSSTSSPEPRAAPKIEQSR